MAREVGPVAPVLSGAEEEDLHAGLPALCPGGEHIRFGHGLRVDALMLLDLRQRADAVAIDRGALEIEFAGGLFHQLHKLLLRLAATAFQEVARFGEKRRISVRADLAGAGRAASLDLIEQAGTGT